MSIEARDIVAWLRAAAAALEAQREQLIELDRAIGDGDHGANMDRGFKAAMQRVEALDTTDIGQILRTVAMALIATVGGAAGPLYGTFFMQMASQAAGKASLSPAEWAAALEAGLQGVTDRGRAQKGDKTMVDALAPGIEALKQALAEGADLAEALRRCAVAAEEGMRATIPLVARRGRASYLGERSAGHQDPGATSAYLILRAAAEALGAVP